MIRFLCRKCGSVVSAPDEGAGRKGRCPQCGQSSVVPETSEEIPGYAKRASAGRGLWVVAAAGAAAVLTIAVVSVVLIGGWTGSGRLPEPTGRSDETQLAEQPSETAERPAPVDDGERLEVADTEPAQELADEPPQVAQEPTTDTPEPQDEDAASPVAREPTGRWDPQSTADVSAMVFGSHSDSESDRITDMVALPDGSLLICGVIHGLNDWVEGVPMRRPGAGGGGVGRDSPFVAKVAYDLSKLEWVSVMGAETFKPSRMAVAPDGSIYLGGEKGDEIKSIAPDEDWDGRHSVIAKLCEEGRELEWVRAGGANQTGVTGLDVDDKGRVYWTAGTRGARMAAYLIRLNPDGSSSEWDYEATRHWAVDLHHNDEQLNQEGEFWWFYKRGWNEGEQDGYFDYDGEDGWAPVRFWLHGIREGGQVIVLPDGDIIVSGTMQYDFQVRGKRRFPAFDLLLARYRSDGKLLWSTNLYMPGDSVHTPDQKAQDLHYDPNTGNLYVLAWQHGSNVYRFKGDLVGDTGNLSIYWLGRVDVQTGDLRDGWYFHNIRPDSNGHFQDDGTPTGWPALSGNYISRVRTDDEGRVYITGRGATKTWTCENTHQSWPGDQWGRYGFLYVLTPELDRILYATLIRGTETDDDGEVIGGSSFDGLAVTPSGVYIGGWTDAPSLNGLQRSAITSFLGVDVVGKADSALVRLKWD